MRRLASAAALLPLVLAAPASAQPAAFAHGTVDQRFTATQPGAPTGFGYTGSYHAAGDAAADPPYMRRMTFSGPPGLRYDTSVPARCTAGDLELATRGPAACPDASRIGSGTTVGKIFGSFSSTLELDMLNNAGEQIMVARSPFVATISRGRIHPDGTIEFASPTCWPSLDPPGCPLDDALQMRTAMTVPPYTRSNRSYLTTPPTCPVIGRWQTTIRFWWADDTEDTVVSEQPCARPVSAAPRKRRRAGAAAFALASTAATMTRVGTFRSWRATTRRSSRSAGARSG